MTESDDGLPGPVRSQVWDVALGQLARYSSVELDEVVAALDVDDVSRDEVRGTIERGLVRHDWLKRPDEERDVWLPDVRAFALMDLTRRAGDGVSVDQQPTDAGLLARAVV